MTSEVINEFIKNILDLRNKDPEMARKLWDNFGDLMFEHDEDTHIALNINVEGDSEDITLDEIVCQIMERYTNTRNIIKVFINLRHSLELTKKGNLKLSELKGKSVNIMDFKSPRLIGGQGAPLLGAILKHYGAKVDMHSLQKAGGISSIGSAYSRVDFWSKTIFSSEE